MGVLYFSPAHRHYFCLSVCLLIFLNNVALIIVMVQPWLWFGLVGGAYWFSVCSVLETCLGLFSRNFTSLTYHFISHLNPDIFGKRQAWTKTWYLFMDCDTNYCNYFRSIMANASLHHDSNIILSAYLVTRYSKLCSRYLVNLGCICHRRKQTTWSLKQQ